MRSTNASVSGFACWPLYTLARKDYIHKCLLSELISRNITFQLQDLFSGINFPKITYQVFVCDLDNYMDKLFTNHFLEKSHFSYMK